MIEGKIVETEFIKLIVCLRIFVKFFFRVQFLNSVILYHMINK